MSQCYVKTAFFPSSNCLNTNKTVKVQRQLLNSNIYLLLCSKCVHNCSALTVYNTGYVYRFQFSMIAIY